jgi:hypothetical protein
VAQAIKNMPRSSAKSRAMNSPRRALEIWPLLGAMMTVSRPASKKSQSKKMRKLSCWSMPPKSGKLPQGVASTAAPVSASQKIAPTINSGSRFLLCRTIRSWMNIAITAQVSTVSGRKKRSEAILFMRAIAAAG